MRAVVRRGLEGPAKPIQRSSSRSVAPPSNDELLNGVCPYFTMFPISFPKRALGSDSRKGLVVADPFCGRGTTLYAARLRGHFAYGVDANPTAVAISAAKLAHATPSSILAAYDSIARQKRAVEVPIGAFWESAYEGSTLKSLCHIRSALLADCESASRLALRAICLGILHGPLRKTVPSYISNQMPRTFAPKPKYSVAYWNDNSLVAPKVDLRELIAKKAKRFFGTRIARPSGKVSLGDSRLSETLPKLLADKQVDWIITSPPYYGMRTYLTDQWLRLWFLGGSSSPVYEAENQVSHSTCQDFADDLKKVWNNLGAVAKKSCKMVIRFGSIGERAVDPLQIIKTSLEDTKWRIQTIHNAGSSAGGRRQANHFLKDAALARPEYDIWATIRPSQARRPPSRLAATRGKRKE